MLELTAPAIAALREVIPDNEAGLRLSASVGGCAGIQYRMALECDGCDGDTVCEVDGVRIFLDQASVPLLKGTRIDFAQSAQGPGFVFDNPNFVGRCSCGK